MKRRHWLVTSILLEIGLLLMGGGCGEAGRIYVDRPEVFTRERLISQRVRERAWLERKLRDEYSPTYQGLSDYRKFEGIIAGVAAKYDPLQGKLAAVEGESEIDRAKRDAQAIDGPREENGSGDRNDNTPRDPNIWVTRQNEIDRPNVPDPTRVARTSAELTSIEKIRDEKAFRDAINAMINETELDDAHDLYGQSLYTLKFDVTIEPRSNHANMGIVRLEMIFDEAVPEPNRTCAKKWRELKGQYQGTYDKWRRRFEQDVNLEVKDLQNRYLKYESPDERVELYRTIALTIQKHEDVLSHYGENWGANSKPTYAAVAEFKNEIIQSGIPERNHLAMQISLPTDVPESNLVDTQIFTKLSDQKELFEATLRGLKLVEQNILNNNKIVEDPDGEASLALCAIVMQRYEPLTKLLRYIDSDPNDPEERGCLTFASPRLIERKPRPPRYVVQLRLTKGEEREKELEVFMRGLRELQLKHKPYVYSVEPKEYAQNISSIAAFERLRNFVLSLKAALPSTGLGDVEGYLQTMTRSQAALHAILRRPLIVGFADERNRFGWVFGPRFQIDEKKPGRYGFAHGHAQHSVRASIVAPAWETTISLKGAYQWVKPDSRIRTPQYFPGKNQREYYEGCIDKKLPIRLPGNYSTLTKAFMGLAHLDLRKPHIFIQDDDFRIILQEGSETEQSFLIHGKGLWQNPRVFVGNQEAARLEVLPNMEGLYVTISDVKMPPLTDEAEAKVDLTIVTSRGFEVLEDAVTIRPEVSSGPGIVTPFLRLKSNYAMQNKRLVFTTIPERMPPGLYDTRLRVRPKGQEYAQDYAVIDTEAPRLLTLPRPREVSWELNSTENSGSFTTWNKPLELEAEFAVRLHEDGARQSALTGARKSFVCFPPETSFQLMIETKQLTFDSNGMPNQPLNIKLPAREKLLYKAFPPPKGNIGDGLLRLKVRLDNGGNSVFKITPGGEGGDGSVQVAKEDLADVYGELKSAAGGNNSIKIVEAKLLGLNDEFATLSKLEGMNLTLTFKKE